MEKQLPSQNRRFGRPLLEAAGAIALSALVGGVLWAINKSKRPLTEEGGWHEVRFDNNPHLPETTDAQKAQA